MSIKQSIAFFMAILTIVICCTGCSGKDASNKTTTTNLQSIEVDIDLTKLSSTMIYSEVYNMVTNPNDYMGKTVKMKGLYSTEYYDVTDSTYFYVIIADATACCQQGLEFIWDGDHQYPDDYPETDSEIEVTGIFSSYEELGSTYYYILANTVSVL